MPQAAGMRLIDNGNVSANVRPRRERNRFKFTCAVPFQGFRSHAETLTPPDAFHRPEGTMQTASKHAERGKYDFREKWNCKHLYACTALKAF